MAATWKYYNHALVPDHAPHEPVDVSDVQNGTIWEKCPRGGYTVLARWTSDFDCGEETNWWYVIKDTPYDLNTMKAKRRYEINKGRKNFDVRRIDPGEYAQELYQVQVAAFRGYPAKYRPQVDEEAFVKSCAGWKGVCIGAFLKEERERPHLCGYAYLTPHAEYVDFQVQKTDPQYESKGLNAALVDGVLLHFSQELASRKYRYILDGARSINHETHFQDYLEKYFGFRKAYCKLHIAYRPGFGFLVNVAYRFRRLLDKLDSVGAVHLVNSVLRMEALKRQQVKKNE